MLIKADELLKSDDSDRAKGKTFMDFMKEWENRQDEAKNVSQYKNKPDKTSRLNMSDFFHFSFNQYKQ